MQTIKSYRKKFNAIVAIIKSKNYFIATIETLRDKTPRKKLVGFDITRWGSLSSQMGTHLVEILLNDIEEAIAGESAVKEAMGILSQQKKQGKWR